MSILYQTELCFLMVFSSLIGIAIAYLITDHISVDICIGVIIGEIIGAFSVGKVYELMAGIPSLAFTDQSVPITIWIDEKSNTISKVEINKIDVIQAILDKNMTGEIGKAAKVEKAILTYHFLEINTFDNIPMPQ